MTKMIFYFVAFSYRAIAKQSFMDRSQCFTVLSTYLIH